MSEPDRYRMFRGEDIAGYAREYANSLIAWSERREAREGLDYVVEGRISPDQAERVLLHEVREHQGGREHVRGTTASLVFYDTANDSLMLNPPLPGGRYWPGTGEPTSAPVRLPAVLFAAEIPPGVWIAVQDFYDYGGESRSYPLRFVRVDEAVLERGRALAETESLPPELRRSARRLAVGGTNTFYRGLRSLMNETRVEKVVVAPDGTARAEPLPHPEDEDPDYAWEYSGTSPRRLADALLYDAAGEEATRFGVSFMNEVVVHLSWNQETERYDRRPPRNGWKEEWRISAEGIRAWIADPRERGGPEGPGRPFG